MMGAYAYTIVQPPVPLEAITPLERLVLGELMQTRARKNHLHLCAYEALRGEIELMRHDVVKALRASQDHDSLLNAVVARRVGLASPDADTIRLRLDTDLSLESILQDIVRRAPDLPHLIVTSGHIGSSAEPDLVSVITTCEIRQPDMQSLTLQ